MATPAANLSFSHLANNELFADVHFVVGDQRFPGHRAVLGQQVSAWNDLFVKHWNEKKSEPQTVKIENIDANAFKPFLEFAYAGSTAGLNCASFQGLLTASKLYNHEKLQKECIEFFKSRLTPANALNLYLNAPPEIGREGFLHTYLSNNFANVVGTGAFFSLDAKQLRELVAQDTLRIPELALFRAVLDWATYKLTNGDTTKQTTPAEMQKLLVDVLPAIRFPLFNIGDLATIVSSAGVLSDNQMLELFNYVSQKEGGIEVKQLPKISFKADPRTPKPIESYPKPKNVVGDVMSFDKPIAYDEDEESEGLGLSKLFDNDDDEPTPPPKKEEKKEAKEDKKKEVKETAPVKRTQLADLLMTESEKRKEVTEDVVLDWVIGADEKGCGSCKQAYTKEHGKVCCRVCGTPLCGRCVKKAIHKAIHLTKEVSCCNWCAKVFTQGAAPKAAVEEKKEDRKCSDTMVNHCRGGDHPSKSTCCAEQCGAIKQWECAKCHGVNCCTGLYACCRTCPSCGHLPDKNGSIFVAVKQVKKVLVRQPSREDGEEDLGLNLFD